MIRTNIIRTIFVAISVTLVAWIAIGCQRPQVGGPGYEDPMADPSPYEAAEEFEYLVDLERGVETLTEAVGPPGREPSGAAPMGARDLEEALDVLGISGLDQEQIMAEANESMIHASGLYRLTSADKSLLKGLAEAGGAEVELPGHFPQDRWMGHVFIARPGDLVAMGFDAVEESLEGMSEMMGKPGTISMTFDLDSLMAMCGFDEVEEIYEWMGGELVIFDLVNPDFDIEGEPGMENVPFYTLLAIASSRPDQGLDVLETFLEVAEVMSQMVGFTFQYERGEVEGYDAIIIPSPTFEGTMLEQMFTEEQMEQLADVPPTVAVAIPGYLFISDQLSVEAALDMFNRRGAGTGRRATIEAEWNWDLFMDAFLPSNPGRILSMVGDLSPELQDLFERFYEETRDIGELGSSRVSVLIEDGEHFQLDVYTSRESIRLFEKVQALIEDTPAVVWRELGRQVGEAISQQGGFGGMGGGQEFEFEFKPESGSDSGE